MYIHCERIPVKLINTSIKSHIHFLFVCLFGFLFFWILFFLYTAGSYYLSILYILVYICQSQTPRSSHHHHPTPAFPPWYPYVCSLHLCLYFCLANRFICTIFLDSTYMRQYMIFVFLWLTSLCMTVSRSIHVSTNDPVSFLFMAE